MGIGAGGPSFLLPWSSGVVTTDGDAPKNNLAGILARFDNFISLQIHTTKSRKWARYRRAMSVVGTDSVIFNPRILMGHGFSFFLKEFGALFALNSTGPAVNLFPF